MLSYANLDCYFINNLISESPLLRMVKLNGAALRVIEISHINNALDKLLQAVADHCPLMVTIRLTFLINHLNDDEEEERRLLISDTGVCALVDL